MTKGKPDLDAMAPPPRRTAREQGAFDTPAEGAKVQFNVRIHADRAKYVRILAATRGCQPGDIVEEALALLEAKEAGQ